MRHWVIVGLVAAAVGAADRAAAQDGGAAPGRVEVTVVPAGGVFFTESNEAGEPSFGNYDLGGAVAVNVNRYLGVEGELSAALGIAQNLRLGGLDADQRSPNMLHYSGNLVVSIPNGSALVPYAAAGLGGLSLFEKAALGVGGTETFLTGNVGGGVKWYSGRWGLRGDYRFVTVRSRDDAPAFFGQATRYGHRVYGAVLLNVVQ